MQVVVWIYSYTMRYTMYQDYAFIIIKHNNHQFEGSCNARHLFGRGDSVCCHLLDCCFSSGVYECIHVSSIVITWQRKVSPSCSYHSKCILAVSISCHFPIPVWVWGTQWAQTFHRFSFFFLKMIWTVDATIPSSLSTAVRQVVPCTPVMQRARVRSPVGTSFLGVVFLGFFLTCKTNVRKL